MSFAIRRWYDVALVLGVLAIMWLIVGNVSTLQVILLLNFVVLVAHQCEEMRWPGGSPWILNEVFNRKEGPADRYPLNQANCAFINYAGLAFYLVAVFFPQWVWLGIAQQLFGMVGQFVVHGIVINRKLKTWYNPGLAAVVFGHIPLGIWYFVEVYRNHLVSDWDWLFAVVTLAVFVVVVMRSLGYGLLTNKDTRYPFERWEMLRWNRISRLQRAGITPLPLGADTSS